MGLLWIASLLATRPCKRWNRPQLLIFFPHPDIMHTLHAPSVSQSSTAAGINARHAGRSRCAILRATHQHQSSVHTSVASQHNEAEVASTSEPAVLGRRAALGLLAVAPVVAKAGDAWAVQVCGAQRGHTQFPLGFRQAVCRLPKPPQHLAVTLYPDSSSRSTDTLRVSCAVAGTDCWAHPR